VQGTRCPFIQRQFWTKRLKLVTVKSMMRMKRTNTAAFITCLNCKYYLRSEILFACFSYNSTHGIHFLSHLALSRAVVPHAQNQILSYYSTEYFLRLTSSLTTSKDAVIPGWNNLLCVANHKCRVITLP